MRLADLSGRSVAVWGSGPEARAALRAIAAHEPSRLIAVDDTARYLAVRWEDEPAPLAGGDHAFPALVTADVVVRSPEVAPTHPWLTDLHDRGIPVTTGESLWMTDHAPQALVITGGDARGSTAALITHLLAASVRPAPHGGGGVPLLALPAAELYVAELSPAQCAALTTPPRVVVVTAFAGEPLDPGREASPPDSAGPNDAVVGGVDAGTAGGAATGGGAAGGGAAGDAATGGVAMGGAATGGGAAGDAATGGVAMGGAATGDGAAGDAATGGGVAGDAATGGGVAGGAATGGAAVGGAAVGNADVGGASGGGLWDVVGLLRRGPEMVVVDGTDLSLRDAIRGITDLNGFPPIPAAAEDSRFRIEDGQVYCSDEPLFPRDALRQDADHAGRALCVALAVLDGLGIDVPGTRDDLREVVAAFTPIHAPTPK